MSESSNKTSLQEIDQDNFEKVQALYQYSNYNATRLNRSLRQNRVHGFNLDVFEKEQIQKLNQIAAESRTVREQTFYRGCSIESFKKPDGSYYSVGETIFNPSFLSTSSNMIVAKEFSEGRGGIGDPKTLKVIQDAPESRSDGIIYEISVPKDFPIVEVNHFLTQNNIQNMWYKQDEVLLGNNGAYKVVEIEKNNQNQITNVNLLVQNENVENNVELSSSVENKESRLDSNKFITTLTNIRQKIKKILLTEIRFHLKK